MNALSIALFIAPILLSIWICHVVAVKKGLNKRFWLTMAIAFGPFAVPFIFFAKPKKTAKDQ